MQQNLLYEESLGNCNSYFSHSMGVFFPSDPHPTVYFTIWEMHAFPHPFPIVQENATKPIVWGEPGKLVLILSHSMGVFFPLDSHFMVYFITWEMYVFPHQFPIPWEKTAKPIKVCEISPWKNPTKPIICGEPGRLVLIVFP